MIKTVQERADLPVSCPQCISAATLINCGSLELDICGRCHGTWFDRSELDAFVQAVDDPSGGADFREAIRLAVSGRSSTAERTYLECPLCKQTLLRRVHARVTGAIAHTCTVHGSWVQGPDLLKVLAAVEDYGASGSAARAAQAAEDQQRSDTAELLSQQQRSQTAQINQRMWQLWALDWFL
jgi:Zn-finger nucleic acid-binding protein